MELETRFLFLVMVVIVECKTGEGSGHILLRKKYFNKKKLLSLLRSPYRRDPWGGSDTNLLFLLWGNLAGSHLQKGFQENYSSRELYVGLFPFKGSLRAVNVLVNSTICSTKIYIYHSFIPIFVSRALLAHGFSFMDNRNSPGPQNL